MAYRTVVLGAGGIAKSHFEAIKKTNEFTAIAVADIHYERAQEFSTLYDVKPYRDYKQMIDELKPDVAIITLPHFLHKGAAVYCVKQGCHIMLEKPMAMNITECDEIIAYAEQYKIKLMVGHTQHYLASNIKAKQVIDEEDLGSLIMVNDFRHVDYFRETRPDWFLQKELSGGGIMMNLGSHSIDKIQWITGIKFRSVMAKLSYFGNRGNVEGSGCLYLVSSDGVPVTISQSGYGGIVGDETEFIFTKGCIRLKTGQGTVSLIKNKEIIEQSLSSHLSPFELQYQELHAAIQGTAPIQCTGEYARSIIQILEAIYKSDKSGQVVVI